MKDTDIILKGTVTTVQPNSKFEVTTEKGHKVIATLSGKLRTNRIRILLGDTVDVEISEYDVTKGRIIWRYK